MKNNLNDFQSFASFAHQAEEAVICSLLLKQDCWPEISPVLTPGMFESPAFGFIYGAMQALYERGVQPDLVTTETEMRKRDPGYFAEINGLAAVSAGMRNIRQSLNVAAYANEVKRCYLLRKLRSVFTVTLSKAGLDESDPEELINGAERELLELRKFLENAPSLHQVGEIAGETLAYHLEKMEHPETLKQVKTGLAEFDAITGGMHNGELYVLGGRPGDGKSSVALQIALNAALQGNQSCLFSMEMTDLHIMNRYFAGHAGVPPAHLRASGLTADEIERMRKLTENWQKLPFYVDYTPGNRVENIRSQVMIRKKQEGCDLVIVDYLNLLEGKPGKGETLEQFLARQIRALKTLAIEADCPVLVLSQMNRASEQRKDTAYTPVLSDLRDSGTIEQVADCVFFVYRPDRHGVEKDPKTGENLKNTLLLMVVKNRNGETGIARVIHNDSFTLLTNPDGKISF